MFTILSRCHDHCIEFLWLLVMYVMNVNNLDDAVDMSRTDQATVPWYVTSSALRTV